MRARVRTMPVADPLPTTYICYWCGIAEVKTLWGVGRITCPHCKRIAPSPSEASELESHPGNSDASIPP